MYPIQFISLGPGDPELISLKGWKALQATDYIYCPATLQPDGTHHSRSMAILQQLSVPQEKIHAFSLPMHADRNGAMQSYRHVCEACCQLQQQGVRVAIVAEGDAGFYSSIHYIYEELEMSGTETEMIAGIPAFIAAGASGHLHIACQEQRLTVLPGVSDYQEIEQRVEAGETVVLMKLSRSAESIRRCIRLHPHYDYRYFENIGLPEEKQLDDASMLQEYRFPYFSLLIVRKPTGGLLS